MWRFHPGSTQGVCLSEISEILRRGEIDLGIPMERWGGRLIEVAHQEDPYCADKKHQRHDNKADPVNYTAHQEPLFILLRWRENTKLPVMLIKAWEDKWM